MERPLHPRMTSIRICDFRRPVQERCEPVAERVMRDVLDSYMRYGRVTGLKFLSPKHLPKDATLMITVFPSIRAQLDASVHGVRPRARLRAPCP